jgi:uncharacterized protein (TIGR03435 family)
MEEIMSKRMRLSAIMLALLAIFDIRSIQAQQPTGPKPTFEVASIKIAKGCGNTNDGAPIKIKLGPSYQPGGRYFTCSLLMYILADAYQMELFSPIIGLPNWSKDIFFQIDAKAEGNPDKAQMHLMVQSLLEDRFKLWMHREKGEIQAYSLVVAKGGDKLQQAKDEHNNPVLSRPTPEQRKNNGLGIKVSLGPIAVLIGKSVTMDELAQGLSSVIARGGRKVVDKTGLLGWYDIQMQYANPLLEDNSGPDTESSAPNVFTAIQEQLGLKLEVSKIPSNIFVIDNLEKPSEN